MMPETTRDQRVEALRYNANKEATMTDKNDEDLIEEVADYMMVTAQQVQNPNLASALRDAANGLISNKSALARGGAGQEEPAGMPAGPTGGAPMPPPQMV